MPKTLICQIDGYCLYPITSNLPITIQFYMKSVFFKLSILFSHKRSGPCYRPACPIVYVNLHFWIEASVFIKNTRKDSIACIKNDSTCRWHSMLMSGDGNFRELLILFGFRTRSYAISQNSYATMKTIKSYAQCEN